VARVSDLLDLGRSPGFLWLCVLIMLCAANESSYAGWIATYFTASGVAPVTATWLLASHWGGLVVGRALFAGRIERAKARAITRGALAGAIAAAMFVAAPPLGLLSVAPFAAGVSIAIVMPTSLALAGERHPRWGGAVFGILLTVAQVGSTLLPALIGIVAQHAGVSAGMSLLVLNGVAIALVVRRIGGIRN
jgi:fucose permease